MSKLLPYSKVLVTGGAGFIGSHIVDHITKHQDIEVVVLDDFSSGNPSNLSESMQTGRVNLVKGDINDKELVMKCLKDVELVFHEAAIVSVQRSITEPEMTRQVNVEGTRCILRASADSSVRKVIIASSAAVYGDPGTLIQSEDSPLSPLSPYALSKLESEKLCKHFNQLTGLESVALRYFNIYGDRSVAGQYAGVINIFAERLIANVNPIIFGDGFQTRDFINVKDIVAANILAATSTHGVGKTFNVGTGRAITISELAKLESEIITGKSEPGIIFKPPRLGDVRHSCADISLIRNELGFKPAVDLESGLIGYISYAYPSVKAFMNQDI